MTYIIDWIIDLCFSLLHKYWRIIYRNEINQLTIALQQTNAKISSDNKQPPELKRKDLRSENKIKADKIRDEIDDLVKQEAAIIKSLFDTNISRAKTTFREYL